MSEHVVPGARPRPRRLVPLPRMAGRDPAEAHRTATPLELLFDLCFVGAVSQAADELGRFVEAGEVGRGVSSFMLVFFAIWWAWVNFTWFASAYDTDDVFYRLMTFVQITGALILAAGVPKIMVHHDFALGVTGYVVMRVALVTQWLRAAHGDPRTHRTALRYATGVTAVQILWIALLAVPSRYQLAVYVPLLLLDLLIPVWAERAGETSWHPHHIAERYGLFTIIVIGESVLTATTAIQAAFDQGGFRWDLVGVIAGGLLIVFSMWWVYFAVPAHTFITSFRRAAVWAYGHYAVFASAAAVGAGLGVAVTSDIAQTHISGTVARAAVTIPVALYLVVAWALHLRPHAISRPAQVATPVTAAGVLAVTFTPVAVLLAGLLTAALVALKVVVEGKQDQETVMEDEAGSGSGGEG
ncbi:MAG TPA: low temperature requirement protein A [Actinocrinis sp.]|nr:low temperature requirement protein A [Actinocrinis sp.]